MKRALYFLLTGLLFSCNSANMNDEVDVANNVLMLKVDYTTNVFEGGTEFSFAAETNNFTIVNEYVPPGDFGSVKLIYKELNESLFDGGIIWMGTGEMTFPEKLNPADSFDALATADFVKPGSGFENVFNPNNQELDYTQAWLNVQYLVKVREYISANPTQTVKIFLYTPSVGVGDPLDWDWIIYLKK